MKIERNRNRNSGSGYTDSTQQLALTIVKGLRNHRAVQIEQDGIAALFDGVTYLLADVIEGIIVYLAAGLGVGGHRDNTVGASSARDREHSGECEICRAINADGLLASRWKL
jgi:hypothetical protein